MHGPKSPYVRTTLEDEFIWGREFFSDLRKMFPDTEIVFLYGNHEDRLDRFIIKNCKTFWNILTIDKQCRLDDLNIKWHRYNKRYRLEESNFFIQHSPPSYSSPQACFTTYPDCSSLFGCSHRVGMSARTGENGIYYSYFNGWLSNWDLTPEHKEIFRFIKGHNKWQNCFSVATCIDGKEVINNQYLISNYKTVVDGNIYEG